MKTKKNNNKQNKWSSNDFRSMNDIRLAKQHYQYEIELHENVLLYEFKELRQNFSGSVKASLRKFGTQMMVVSIIKLVKARFSKKKKT